MSNFGSGDKSFFHDIDRNYTGEQDERKKRIFFFRLWIVFIGLLFSTTFFYLLDPNDLFSEPVLSSEVAELASGACPCLETDPVRDAIPVVIARLQNNKALVGFSDGTCEYPEKNFDDLIRCIEKCDLFKYFASIPSPECQSSRRDLYVDVRHIASILRGICKSDKVHYKAMLALEKANCGVLKGILEYGTDEFSNWIYEKIQKIAAREGVGDLYPPDGRFEVEFCCHEN